MDYFEEEEKKQKEAKEEKIYQELYAKQARIARIVMLACFVPIGLIFLILGVVLSITFSGFEEEIVGYVFIGMGVMFSILGILLYLLIPKKGNYEKYKKQVNRFGGFNVYSLSIKIGFLEEQVRKLSREVGELKRNIKR